MRTPGPWFADGTEVLADGGLVIALCDEEMHKISKPAQIANALAIAAVPDLIEALKAFLVKPSIGMDRELILAKAALTKAGETL